jgi:hypothetical protein
MYERAADYVGRIASRSPYCRTALRSLLALTEEHPTMDDTAAIAGAADNGGALRQAAGIVEADPLRTIRVQFCCAAQRGILMW